MKFLFENWRGYINEKLMLKPGENGWDLYRQLVGQAYMDAPTEQPGAKASYEALGEWVNKFFERVVGVVDVEFVDYHPYKTLFLTLKQTLNLELFMTSVDTFRGKFLSRMVEK